MKAVRTPAVFDAVLRTVAAISPWLDVLEPTSEVYAMGGLQSTLVQTVRDGAAVVHGLHLVGDACSTTSPTYGRGLSWALAHAGVLADAIARDPDDLEGQARAVDAWISLEVTPFYLDAVVGDRGRVAAMRHAMLDQTATPPAASESTSSIEQPPRPTFPQLVSASAADAYVWHRFARYQSLLATPQELYDDPTLRARVAALTSSMNAATAPADDDWADRIARGAAGTLGGVCAGALYFMTVEEGRAAEDSASAMAPPPIATTATDASRRSERRSMWIYSPSAVRADSSTPASGSAPTSSPRCARCSRPQL